VDVEGCTYHESLQAVAISGGVASNVVPDRAELMLNYRFAPDLDLGSAAASLREVVTPWLEAEDGWEVVDSAPAARPFLDHPLLAGLVSAAGGRVRAKLGWTDVAFFAERGVPAANFGPGDPDVAHTPGESVTRASLEEARRTLGQLMGG
jgi:succinyl-diaminopimelate desuccinylase